MNLKIAIFILLVTSNCLIAQTFGGLYTSHKKYLSNIPDTILSDFYFKAQTSKKIVALTFDDGPFKNTTALISFLVKENIPATFFLVGQNISPKYINLYDNSLFTVGIHTYKHSDYRRLSYQEKKEDIEHCLAIFKKYKLPTKYFRPAYGIIDNDIKNLLSKNNLKGIIWSIDSQDWNRYKGEKMSNNIVNHLQGGDIILFHDRTSVQDVKNVVNVIKDKGYQIVGLEEIMIYKNVFPQNGK